MWKGLLFRRTSAARLDTRRKFDEFGSDRFLADLAFLGLQRADIFLYLALGHRHGGHPGFIFGDKGMQGDPANHRMHIFGAEFCQELAAGMLRSGALRWVGAASGTRTGKRGRRSILTLPDPEME